jgi:hypothetical protein
MVITMIILYYLSGVHDVAYLSNQLKDLEISSATPPVDIGEASENSTVLETASRNVKKSIAFLKRMRQLFDNQEEMWEPEKTGSPSTVKKDA